LKGEGNYFTLKDISMSGTYLDGKKIELARLRAGQRIRLGKTEMVYHEKR
jgi:pSer/pThr/pTyr-binding forkhead associated (FHA) protein